MENISMSEAKSCFSEFLSRASSGECFVIMPFDESTGRQFGTLKADLESNGEPLENLDLQIASIAIETN